MNELVTGYKLGEIHAFLLQENAGTQRKSLQLYQYPIQSVYYGLFFNLRIDLYKDLELRNRLAKNPNIEEAILGYGISRRRPYQ